MSTAVAVTTIACGTLVKLALIGAVLRLLLAVAPRVSMGNPRQSARQDPPKNDPPPGLPEAVST